MNTEWVVQGPFHSHKFRFVTTTHVLYDNYILTRHTVEHWMGNVKVESSEWGHGLEEAIKDSHKWEKVRDNYYTTQLLSHDVLKFDLPCCGGKFHKVKEITDYFTLQIGHCSKCKKKWEITDGHHFTSNKS